MNGHSFPITDAVEKASPVLDRMRLDGLDRVTVPFAESYVQAWLGGPQHTNLNQNVAMNVMKV